MLQVLQDWNPHYGPFDDNILLVTLDVMGLPPSVGDLIHIMDHVLKNNVGAVPTSIWKSCCTFSSQPLHGLVGGAHGSNQHHPHPQGVLEAVPG